MSLDILKVKQAASAITEEVLDQEYFDDAFDDQQDRKKVFRNEVEPLCRLNWGDVYSESRFKQLDNCSFQRTHSLREYKAYDESSKEEVIVTIKRVPRG